MSSCATIKRSGCTDTTLLERLHAVAPHDPWVGFFLGRTARWVRTAERGWESSTGPETLDEVYSAHLFVPGARLDARWTRTTTGGELTVVREVTSAEADPAVRRYERAAVTRQLLWGTTREGAPAGWTRLSSARTGDIDVPFEHEGGRRLQLMGQEYTTTDQHGNVGVVVEVLQDLEFAP